MAGREKNTYANIIRPLSKTHAIPVHYLQELRNVYMGHQGTK